MGCGSPPESNTPPSSVHSIDLRKGPGPTDLSAACLLAEDNPITAKIIEMLLGFRVVVVADGTETMSVAMGDISTSLCFFKLYPVSTLFSWVAYFESGYLSFEFQYGADFPLRHFGMIRQNSSATTSGKAQLNKESQRDHEANYIPAVYLGTI